MTLPKTTQSRPLRARGLKLEPCGQHAHLPAVAPPAGAWIETILGRCWLPGLCPSRPLRARGLKPVLSVGRLSATLSRPLRARGLKRVSHFLHGTQWVSRPLRARGLKLADRLKTGRYLEVAPPAGAWIETFVFILAIIRTLVAPPAGAWIETPDSMALRTVRSVAPPAGAWIETRDCHYQAQIAPSRAPCGRVD